MPESSRFMADSCLRTVPLDCKAHNHTFLLIEVHRHSSPGSAETTCNCLVPLAESDN